MYRRVCDATKQPVISIYSPDKPYKVYDQKVWRSDVWDPMDYGRDFDFSKSFTEQFGELMREVPRLALINVNAEASEYVNCASSNKSCHLSFDVWFCEECLYSRTVYKSDNIFDCLYVSDSHHCYECINGYNLFGSLYSFNCFSSTKISFCINCRWVHDCFLCNNLENTSYCIENKQYTKEEYEKMIKTYTLEESIAKYKEMFQNADIEMFIACEDCTWSFQKNSVRCYNSSGNVSCEDSKFLLDSYSAKNCYDDCYAGIESSEMNLETLGNQDAKQSLFISASFNGPSHVLYCDHCHACQYCFACIWLRNKSYCIFNKQYTKEEYNTLVPKIIEHMRTMGERGEFFHPSLSPFGYNETVAQEYFWLMKSEEENDTERLSVKVWRRKLKSKEGIDYSRFGYHWSDYEAPVPQSDKVVEGKDLPDMWCADLKQQDPPYLQNILSYAIRGEVTWRLFRLQSAEIQFYEKHNLPLPKKHPDQRHLERMTLRWKY